MVSVADASDLIGSLRIPKRFDDAECRHGTEPGGNASVRLRELDGFRFRIDMRPTFLV
jgi:hypothetical protein